MKKKQTPKQQPKTTDKKLPVVKDKDMSHIGGGSGGGGWYI